MRRVPIGLTLATAIALAALVALGGWQLQRLRWKEAILARMAALEHAAPVPLGPVMAAAPAGSAEFTRVEVACAPPARPAPAAYRYSLRDGQIGWRLLTECPLAAAGRYDGVLLDRGLVDRFLGAMAPAPAAFPAPARVIGVLRAPGGRPLLDMAAAPATSGTPAIRVIDAEVLARLAGQSGLSRPAPYFLAVESEAPAPGGVRPAALPRDIPNNHFIYALTWFGLAAALVGVYAARLAGSWRTR